MPQTKDEFIAEAKQRTNSALTKGELDKIFDKTAVAFLVTKNISPNDAVDAELVYEYLVEYGNAVMRTISQFVHDAVEGTSPDRIALEFVVSKPDNNVKFVEVAEVKGSENVAKASN